MPFENLTWENALRLLAWFFLAGFGWTAGAWAWGKLLGAAWKSK